MILIIDDEKNILKGLSTFLNLKGFDVSTAADYNSGLSQVKDLNPDLVILDVFLKGKSGITLLEYILDTTTNIPVIMISGQSDLSIAVEAIKKGAFNFLEKPIDTEKLLILIGNALKQTQLNKEVKNLKDNWIQENLYIGKSPCFVKTVSLAQKAGGTNLNILLTGANGTGKEPLAYFAYLNSKRAGSPWISVNCAAIPPELFESELFGHKKGAFTGAENDRKGFFEIADGGTLFLDEIAEIPIYLQAKLLRAVEYGEIQKIGGLAPLKINVRLISATNRDIEKEINENRFREDLFYRLNQVPVKIPDLDERKEDIPGMIDFFSRKIQKKNGIEEISFTKEAEIYLSNRHYKGNIRELQNFLERIILLSEKNKIDISQIKEIDTASEISVKDNELFSKTVSLKEAKQNIERRYIREQLIKHKWHVKDTATALNILPNNLSRKISEYKIKLHHP